jgi:hypothetical protein
MLDFFAYVSLLSVVFSWCFYALLHKYSIYYFRYIVKKDAPGLTVTKIDNKIGLRIVQNGDIVMKKVFVPDEDRIEGVNSFQDTNKVTFMWYFSAVIHIIILWFHHFNSLWLLQVWFISTAYLF